MLCVLAAGFGVFDGCTNGSGASGWPTPGAFESACVSAGLCDEAPAPPEMVDILCDASLGSGCNRENVRVAIEAAARFAGPRAGSRLRLWAMGPSVAETQVVGELVVPSLATRTRTRRAQLDRFAAHAQSVLTLAVEPTFARVATSRSPLIESLAKIGLADSYGLPRRIVVLSHAREFSSVRDFACGKLPTAGEFVHGLHRRGLLEPGSLTHLQIVFAFVTSSPVGARRCAVRMDREVRIRELWRVGLTRAGASEVRFDSGVPVLVGERPASSPTPLATDRRNAP